MHIVYVCMDSGIPVFGNKGGSVHVQELINSFLKKGHKVTLLYSRAGGKKPHRLSGIDCIKLPCLPAQTDPAFVASVHSLQVVLQETIEQLPRVDLVYERYSLWSYAAIETACRLGIPSCLEVNAYLIYEQSKYRQLLYPDLATECFNRIFSVVDRAYAVSYGLMAQLVEAGISASKLQVIHNGVDTQRFSPRSMGFDRSAVLPAGDIQPMLSIGFCGSLKPWHGVEELIDAFAMHHQKFQSSRLLIVGDGPQRSKIEQSIQCYQLESAVELTGAIPIDQVPGMLVRTNVAVAPYPVLSNMYFSPLKIFEYLALGLCTVASRVGDIPLLIDHDESGILYEAGNIGELAEIFNQLAVDSRQVYRIAKNGRDLAASKYSWDHVVDRILSMSSLG